MHPAASVIYFTTASGCGYGMLILIGLLAQIGLFPNSIWFEGTTLGVATALVTSGLLSSTFHLGHPERAWRAISQWRSSWLSREGVMALWTYVPLSGFALAWMFDIGSLAVWGVVLSASALVTLYTTAMIYRSLKTIHQWHCTHTTVAYLVLGPMTGAVWLSCITAFFGSANAVLEMLSLVLLVAGLVIKTRYWGYADDTKAGQTGASALGLPGGTVKSVEWPHTQANFVMKEMGYAIARKHAQKLRKLTILFLFAVPIGGFLLLPYLSSSAAILMYLIVLASANFGIAVERWLFFAEAKHSVQLYYGAESV